MNNLDIDLEHNLQFTHCLYKYVSVKTPKNRVHEGWLKTIDPITGNIILVTFADDSFEMSHIILIMRDAYEDVSVLRDVDPSVKAALQKLYADDTTHSVTDVAGRKERLIAWIKKNRLPFRETEDGTALVICENATIRPPYLPDSCFSSNGRVLLRVRQLVETLPDETPNSADVKTEVTEKGGDSKETIG